MDADNLNELAKVSYAAGIRPLDYAEHLVGLVLDVHRTMLLAAAHSAEPVPGLDDAALARRILGQLLDAGWIPPAGVS